MLLKKNYIENEEFDQNKFEYDALNNTEESYYPEN
jgi:hypothetical protein